MDFYYQQLMQMLSANQFFQGGIVLAAISWAFYQLKAWPVLAWKKFKYFATYTAYFDDGNDFYASFAEWFAERHPNKFRNVEVRFWYNDQDSQQPNVPSSVSSSPSVGGWSLKRFQFDDSNVLFYGGRWLFIRKSRVQLQMAGNGSAFINSYSISGLFARTAIENLCTEILDRKVASTKQETLRVGVNADGGYFEWRNADIVKTLDHIFFDQKDELKADLDRFVERKEFYRSKGINFKRSYLFYGPAGTGKTSLASAMAKYLDYSLCVINLASIKDDLTLQRIGSLIGKRSVVLLEDIDCILTDREVKSENLNFSTVLNFLDGLYAPSDCIFVMTTNRPEVLDDALTRKGRVDMALKIDYPSVTQIERFMSDFYDQSVKLPVVAGKALSGMSEIQDVCLKNEIAKAIAAVTAILTPQNGHSKTASVVALNG